MPQMPSFAQAVGAQPLQALDAAKAQGQYGLGAAKLDQDSGPDIGSLIGTGASVAGMFL
jgi:hypothetical protein